MVYKLKLRKVGNSVGLVLPKEALGQLHCAEGDVVYLTDAPENGMRITTGDPEFEQQMKIAQRIVKRYRNTLKALAK